MTVGGVSYSESGVREGDWLVVALWVWGLRWSGGSRGGGGGRGVEMWLMQAQT